MRLGILQRRTHACALCKNARVLRRAVMTGFAKHAIEKSSRANMHESKRLERILASFAVNCWSSTNSAYANLVTRRDLATVALL